MSVFRSVLKFLVAWSIGVSCSFADAGAFTLRHQVVSSEETELSFDSVTNRSYTIEYRHSLTAGEWAPLEAFTDEPGTNEELRYTVSFGDLSASGSHFFRVRSVPHDEAAHSALARYEFTSETPDAQVTHPLIAASAFAVSAGNLLYGSAQGASWTGSGVPYAQANSGWSDESASSAKHFTYSLSALDSNEFQITNLTFLARSTERGPAAYALYVNDSFVAAGELPADETISISIPVFVDWTTQAVVRIAGWDDGSRETSGTGQFRVDDVETQGLVREVEEQSEPAQVPSLTIPFAENITENAATITSTITDDGDIVISERGFVWSVVNDFDPAEEGVVVREFGEFAEGTFQLGTAGLPEDSDIFLRAFAVNAAGTGWSDQAVFRTAADRVLAFYTFSGSTPQAQAHRTTISPSDMSISSGNFSFNWVAGQADEWNAFGVEDPYIQASGSWNSDNPQEARRFEFQLEADPGWYMTITGVTFVARATPQGPSAISLALDGDTIFTHDMPEDETLQIHATVEDYDDIETVSIWIQGWTNGTRNTTGGGALRIADVLVTGFMSMDIQTGEPEVEGPSATEIDGHTALLGGTIVDDGGSAIIERGIVWSTLDGFGPPSGAFAVAETGAFELGAFTLTAWQLPPNTPIYYRAFASSAAGTSYSEQATFTTPPLPDGLLSRYDFTGMVIDPHLVNPSITSSHLVHNTGRPGIASLNAASWTGSGVPYAQVSSGFLETSPADARHFIYVLEARNGTTFAITNIQLQARATAQGPSALSILIDDEEITTVNMQSGVNTTIHVPVSGYDEQTLATVKIVGWDNGSRSTSGTGLLQIDDVLTQGSVQGTPIEPIQEGQQVRIASVNVEDGIGAPEDANYEALRSILIRLDADIIAFQELYNNQVPVWEALADELGYPHRVISPSGAISDVQRVGFYSRFPFDSSALLSPGEANEFARPVMRGVFDVPGAEQPLVLWAVHKKALNDELSQFRRAIETHRVLEDVEQYLAAHPDHVNYAVLGDMNADYFTQSQRDQFDQAWFNANASALPSQYELGADITFPVRYSRYPDDPYRDGAIQLERVMMTHPGGYGIWSFINDSFISRLDYIMVSETLAATYPVGEIYNSQMDGPFAGLPKAGAPLSATTSITSSDHFPVFVDLYLSPLQAPQSTSSDGFDEEAVGVAVGRGAVLSESTLAGSVTILSPDRVSLSAPRPVRTLAELSRETRLHIRPHSVGVIELLFFAQSGFNYRLERSDQLAAEIKWQAVLGDEQIEGSDNWISVLDSTPGFTAELRAYRLRMHAPP